MTARTRNHTTITVAGEDDMDHFDYSDGYNLNDYHEDCDDLAQQVRSICMSSVHREMDDDVSKRVFQCRPMENFRRDNAALYAEKPTLFRDGVVNEQMTAFCEHVKSVAKAKEELSDARSSLDRLKQDVDNHQIKIESLSRDLARLDNEVADLGVRLGVANATRVMTPEERVNYKHQAPWEYSSTSAAAKDKAPGERENMGDNPSVKKVKNIWCKVDESVFTAVDSDGCEIGTLWRR